MLSLDCVQRQHCTAPAHWLEVCSLAFFLADASIACADCNMADPLGWLCVCIACMHALLPMVKSNGIGGVNLCRPLKTPRR